MLIFVVFVVDILLMLFVDVDFWPFWLSIALLTSPVAEDFVRKTGTTVLRFCSPRVHPICCHALVRDIYLAGYRLYVRSCQRR